MFLLPISRGQAVDGGCQSAPNNAGRCAPKIAARGRSRIRVRGADERRAGAARSHARTRSDPARHLPNARRRRAARPVRASRGLSRANQSCKSQEQITREAARHSWRDDGRVASGIARRCRTGRCLAAPRVNHDRPTPTAKYSFCICIESALNNDVPGDVIETGVWRGGASIYARAVLQAWDVVERRVWVADSFEGLPPRNLTDYPADATTGALDQRRELAISA